MEPIIKGEPEEIAALVVAVQERQPENALYDYEHGIKLTIGKRRLGGAGGNG